MTTLSPPVNHIPRISTSSNHYHYKHHTQRPLENNIYDNKFIGEETKAPKPNGTTRLYFININGISAYNRHEQLQQTLDNLNNLQADIICFAEHNLAVDQLRTRYDLINTIKRHLPNSRIVLATSDIQSPTAYKPGGCVQIITNTINSRITIQGSDRFGRWTYVGLATKHKTMIFIITTYKPCKNHARSRHSTVYNQQWTMMRNEDMEQPEPRKQFDEDFVKFIQSLQEKAHRMIIVGDFNETRNKSKLLRELQSMGLIDVISSRHANTPPFRSCNKGNNIIDHAICSHSLLSSITSSSYEPFLLNTTSDHRGIVVDFNTRSLLGKQELIVSPDKRGLNASNPIQVEKFIDELQKHWKKLNITSRVSEATQKAHNTDIRDIANNIDRDITKAILRAE